MDKTSGDRRSGSNCRPGKNDFTVKRSHSAAEITVRRANGPLAGSQDAHVAAEAWPASGSADSGSCFQKDFNQALANRIELNLWTPRNDDAADIRMNPVPTENFRGDSQILDASIGA